MQVINPIADCEELCLEISSEDDEIRCTFLMEHLESLIERMEGAGLYCSQIQKDHQRQRCVAWFEPTFT